MQKTRLTALGLTHIWRLTAADAAFIERSAFVSRLFLVGTTDARNQSDRERMRVGSLTLLVYMKGHVGGGPVTDNLWVSADR